MSILIWFLTVVMVLDCLFLVLLILVQLPKKEAGLGQAFGGAATDALFGAGSGNALTKMTKYSTAIFLILTLSLSIMNAHQKTAKSTLEQNIAKLGRGSLPPTSMTPTSGVAATPLPETPATNAAAGTNAPSSSAPKAGSETTPKPATPAPATTPASTNSSVPAAK